MTIGKKSSSGRVIYLALLVSVFVGAGCKVEKNYYESDGTPTGPSAPVTPTTIGLSKSTLDLVVGANELVTVTADYGSKPSRDSLTSSNPNTSVATATIISRTTTIPTTGSTRIAEVYRITAVSVGVARITFNTADNKSVQLTVNVTAPAVVTSLSIAPRDTTIKVNGTFKARVQIGVSGGANAGYRCMVRDVTFITVDGPTCTVRSWSVTPANRKTWLLVQSFANGANGKVLEDSMSVTVIP